MSHQRTIICPELTAQRHSHWINIGTEYIWYWIALQISIRYRQYLLPNLSCAATVRACGCARANKHVHVNQSAHSIDIYCEHTRKKPERLAPQKAHALGSAIFVRYASCARLAQVYYYFIRHILSIEHHASARARAHTLIKLPPSVRHIMTELYMCIFCYCGCIVLVCVCVLGSHGAICNQFVWQSDTYVACSSTPGDFQFLYNGMSNKWRWLAVGSHVCEYVQMCVM